MIDFDEFFEEDSSFENRINTNLANSLKDKVTTPRYPYYLRDNILEVWVSGADAIFFNGYFFKLSFKTFKEIDVSKLDKELFRKAIRLFSKETAPTESKLIRDKFRVIASEKRQNKQLTEKELQQISKYEQRKKGNWS